ncbi:MAG TPA: heavy metal-associated domain-containing protein [Geobacteraceae bacterium]
MEKRGKRVIKLGVALVLALLIGAGVVFALNRPDSGVAADSVTILKTQGATCGSCTARIEKALKEKPGVAAVEVDLDKGEVAVAYDEKVTKPGILAETVTNLGYTSSVLQVMTSGQYKAMTGRDIRASVATTDAGCGDCCNRKRK